MVSSGVDLLRMLMPAVRPVPTEGARPGKQPIESLSFDSLLAEAKQTDATAGRSQGDPLAKTDAVSDTGKTQKPPEPDVLAPLSGLDSIHNASLRRIVAEATDSQ